MGNYLLFYCTFLLALVLNPEKIVMDDFKNLIMLPLKHLSLRDLYKGSINIHFCDIFSYNSYFIIGKLVTLSKKSAYNS